MGGINPAGPVSDRRICGPGPDISRSSGFLWGLLLILSAVYALVCRLLQLIVLVGRSERSKELEILVLRHELAILRRQPRRPQFSPSDRLLLAALSRVLPRRSWGAFPVTPETLLRWHRRLVARHWTYSGRRPGRPRMAREVRVLIVRLARENATWGYVRITGELRKLGIEVSPSLVRNVLIAAGVPPAPQRGRLGWRSFLRQHAASAMACASSRSTPSYSAGYTSWSSSASARAESSTSPPRATLTDPG